MRIFVMMSEMGSGVQAALMPLGPEEHNAMERLGDRVRALREAKVVVSEEFCVRLNPW